MRTFNEIYSELQHYSAFTPTPGNLNDSICSMNCFFSEIAADDENNHIDCFNDLLVRYGAYAGQYIKTGHRRKTFEQYLESIYSVIKTTSKDKTMPKEQA